jgi:hypothetical protein
MESAMRHRQYLFCLLAALSALYLIQLASPLRLNTDATSFLTLAASRVDGQGFVIDGQPTHFPVGYPLMLVALESMGVACSASIIGLNFVMLALGCAGTGYLLRRSFRFGTDAIIFICAMTLLCWVFVKHATLPLSDLPYFGLSMVCLATLKWSTDQSMPRRLVGTGIGAGVMIAAIAVRTVGIALVPALALSCLPADAWRKLTGWFKKWPARSILALALVTVVAVAGCLSVTQTQYFHEMNTEWVGWSKVAQFRLEDWGELVMNTSLAKLPRLLQTIVPWVGTAGAFVVCCGLARRARLEIVDAYALCYTAILLVWPYRDCRFWLPVFPILAAYAWLALDAVGDRTPIRIGALSYVAAYFLMGFAALFFSTRISLSGERFPELYGGGIYRASYRALSGKPIDGYSHDDKADPNLMRLILRYGSAEYLTHDRQSNRTTMR